MPTPSSPLLPDERLAAGAERLEALAHTQGLTEGLVEAADIVITMGCAP
ncbi:hypothetical protein [Streptomyces sp. TBY4]|nr:hypothetical protein [Streptomyces sp. TBY4]MCP3758879.1 hypothetical protein [Streptomyces sp. TBY4]